MSTNGLPVFDETVHNTNAWLKDLMEKLNVDSRNDSYRVLRLTLHALRDRLPVNTAVAFSAQLPMLIRGFYFEGWQPESCPTDDRNEADFVDDLAIAYSFTKEDYEPEWIVKKVFSLLEDKISKGEIEKVKACLPKKLKRLWPTPYFEQSEPLNILN